ncbi:glycosyltransferase family 4 protein [Nocardioides sp. Kera G14]|uniref:glycosyltransferase family 4 protein n=1 Tax=Nocardioides sp. Kera G14 TaxID=2884264 RepID=UPI001D10B0D7|nr:glycosyltransferase family 4 protein [Nocardioides sp. Kera G14]UDY22425.1 glycosyltransferase family 4 protein [Nocardioides sp. Kera G14]
MGPWGGTAVKGRQIVMLSWRDTANPEGGGAEMYLEQVAHGLRGRGDRVTVFTAAYPGAAPDETVDGIRFVRRGGKLSVYLWGMWLLLTGRLGRPDVVVDVQNGLPFFSRLVTRRPVVVLVHHVHREQWPVVYPGLKGRVGWWLESSVAPRLYRHCQYIAVSRATRDELVGLGVSGSRIAVVHNGAERLPDVAPTKSGQPSICVVGRLVPHKRVELAVDAVNALRAEFPELTLTIVGDGWWADELKAYADQHSEPGAVTFLGHVGESVKESVYECSWVMAVPSLKEGWGLVITEAAGRRTPSIAFRSAGGTTESIMDGVSGLLVADPAEFTRRLGDVLRDEVLRKELAEGAWWHAAGHTWEQSQMNFAAVLDSAGAGRVIAASD